MKLRTTYPRRVAGRNNDWRRRLSHATLRIDLPADQGRMNFFFRQHNHRTASLIVFLSSGVWGVMWLPMRHVESLGVDPIWVQCFFMAAPALILLPLTLRSTLASRRDWPVYVATGGLISIGFTFFGIGLMVASVSKTTVLFYLTPIWATLLARFVLGERPGPRRWIAIAAAIIGCSLVMKIHDIDMGFAASDLLGLLSGLFWGAGTVVLRRFPQADFRNMTMVQYVLAVILAAGAALFFNAPLPSQEAVLSGAPWALLFGAFVFLPALMIVFRVSQYLSPGLVGILMLSEVIVAATTAALFLGERLAAMQWFGVVLILAAGVGVALGETPADDSDGAKA